MPDTPGPPDDAIAARLRAAWGVAPERIESLWLGEDADVRVYRVEAAGRSWFLKLRLTRWGADDLGAAVARHLADAGIGAVVAPLPTEDGTLRADLGAFSASLYPFVAGRTGWETGLSPAQWAAYGATLRRVHASALPPDLAGRVPRETFVPTPRWAGVVRGLLAGAYDGTPGDAARDLLAFVAERRAETADLLRRAEDLGRRLRGARLPHVLCHADAHVANVLLDGDGRLHVVDWDQPILAPPERDLMFVLGPALNGVLPGTPEEAAFFRGYGPVAPDPLALAYYRAEWAVGDIGSYAENVVARPDLGEETRRHAVRGVRTVFAPRGIAEAADRSLALLPPER